MIIDDTFSYQSAHGSTGSEIIASGVSIDIEYFTCKIESWTYLGLSSKGIYFTEGDATSSYKFISRATLDQTKWYAYT